MIGTPKLFAAHDTQSMAGMGAGPIWLHCPVYSRSPRAIAQPDRAFTASPPCYMMMALHAVLGPALSCNLSKAPTVKPPGRATSSTAHRHAAEPAHRSVGVPSRPERQSSWPLPRARSRCGIFPADGIGHADVKQEPARWRNRTLSGPRTRPGHPSPRFICLHRVLTRHTLSRAITPNRDTRNGRADGRAKHLNA